MKDYAANSKQDNNNTLDTKGKRKWIYALQPKGKLYQYRSILSIVYLVLFFSIPFIHINGIPLFQFNIPQATFIFFGKVFLPQDFILLGVGMLTSLLFIVVFTLMYGRVFCGWACPQTIFMEMVFRKIEYWIEGSAQKQIQQNKQPWTTDIYIKKVAKHLVFFIVSFLIANTFLAYIIGVKELYKIITEPLSEHVIGFISLIGFTIVFYIVYAYVRELVCTIVCPYGRLQSVLLDKNSRVVAYNYKRGEPRGKRKKNEIAPTGDCIDCNLCVQVCPTGIDIRNGLQLECTNCTACIDACNLMMEKVGYPKDLISITSESAIAENRKPKINYRTKVYGAVLISLVIALCALIISRSKFDATLLRVPGQVLQENKDGTISNLYRIKIVSKSMIPEHYHLQLNGDDVHIVYIGKHVDSLYTGVATEETFFVKVSSELIKKRKVIYKLKIMSGNDVVQTKDLIFIGQY
jgi:cytochrome c oxidase accessory protein FixG